MEGACIPIGSAAFPAPFPNTLEYGSPARGAWNIVHTAMLVPEGHQIYVCADGCLRGVVLTAAEMHAQDRFSCISIRESNVLDGSMERLIIDGTADIVSRLPKRPPAILLYTSCIHHFIGCDLQLVYKDLRKLFPDIDFAECYMNPIMRKSGLTPDELTRRSMYTLLKKSAFDEGSVSIIGCDLPPDSNSDILRLTRAAGRRLHDITLCRSYTEFQGMASSPLNITVIPAARAAADALSERLGQKHLYLPLCFGYEEIKKNLDDLADAIETGHIEHEAERFSCEKALAAAKTVVGNTPVAIDYTAVPRPLGLARLLSEHGFNVKRVYLDAISPEEKADFFYLKEIRPELLLIATVHPKMRFAARETDEPYLAIGQKAAYFTGTRHFVNIIEGGGLYGYGGIRRLAGLLSEAYLEEKDTKGLMQIKGWGCGCCL